MEVLFVCTGNICRSPTAERLATAYAAQCGRPWFRASSAGTRAVIGNAMHHDAARVLEGLGGDASSFHARQLTAKIASKSDLIVPMTKRHRDAVLELAPRLLSRTFTLGELSQLAALGPRSLGDLAVMRPSIVSDKVVDVPDPIGRGIEAFTAAGSLIAELLLPVVDLLVSDRLDDDV